jgi:hypothetical protein
MRFLPLYDWVLDVALSKLYGIEYFLVFLGRLTKLIFACSFVGFTEIC